MYGYNNFGMGGGYGRGGGGTEMMLLVVCCFCCVCVLSLVGGWWSNVFCGVSPAMGRACATPAPTEAPVAVTTGPPSVALDTCNKTWAGASRAANDPRPPLNAAACTSTSKVTGRDCFYWQTQADPLTQLARWVRVPDSDTADARDGACTNPPVVCTPKIDFTKLSGYTDNNPSDLLRVCQAATNVAAVTTAMVPALTKGANDASANAKGGWSDAHSRLFIGKVQNLLRGRDLQPFINNTVLAAQKVVLPKINKRQMSRATFATMLEASLINPTNQPDWIYTTAAQLWSKDYKRFPRTEEGWVAAIATYIRPSRVQNWVALMDSKGYY